MQAANCPSIIINLNRHPEKCKKDLIKIDIETSTYVPEDFLDRIQQAVTRMLYPKK